VLNVPTEKHSHGLRKLTAIKARTRVIRAAGLRVGRVTRACPGNARQKNSPRDRR